jgi:dipeptidase
LRDHAAANLWREADGKVDYAAKLIDRDRDAVTFGTGRCARGAELLSRHEGKLSSAAMMSILRDHGASGEMNPRWHPTDDRGRTICMHAGAAERRGQTTGSMVTEHRDDAILHWVTGTSAPCTGLFKPAILEEGLLPSSGSPTDRFDPNSLWWLHEKVHRAVVEDFAQRLDQIRGERDAVEKRFRDSIDAAWQSAGPGSERLRQTIRECWREAANVEKRWISVFTAARPPLQNTAYGRSWIRHNSIAGFTRRPHSS